MNLTKQDIQNKKFTVVRRGYDQTQVDGFLEEIILALNTAGKEAEADRFELAKYREMEYTLTKTLVTAQKTAQEIVDKAQEEADKIRADAKSEAAYMKAEADRYITDQKSESEAEIAAQRRDFDVQTETIRGRLYAMRDFEQKYREALEETVGVHAKMLKGQFPSENEWDNAQVIEALEAQAAEESEKQANAQLQSKAVLDTGRGNVIRADDNLDLTQMINSFSGDDADLKVMINELL